MSARLGLFGQHKLNQQNQQRNCNNNNKAHPTVLHLSYPLRAMPISTTTTTTTTTKITDPTVFFYLDKTTRFTMQNIERKKQQIEAKKKKKIE